MDKVNGKCLTNAFVYQDNEAYQIPNALTIMHIVMQGNNKAQLSGCHQ